MSLIFKPYSDFISIVGMKSAGKTERTKAYLRSLKRYIIIDATWQLGEVSYIVHFPDRVVPAFKKWKKVSYQPYHMGNIDYQTAFQQILTQSNLTLVIDEIDKFAGGRGYLCEEVKEIVNRGRAQGIGLIGNTRRPFMLHRDIRSNTDHVVCFKLMEIDDRIYMEKWIGVDRESLKLLPLHESYYYNVHTGTLTREAPLF